MKRLARCFAAGACCIVFFCSCTTHTSNVKNAPGSPTVYAPPETVGPIAGIGMESQDVTGMCDKMMRDMMTNPLFMNAPSPPHVIIDSVYFRNESSNRVNLNMITDRLRNGLNRSANGRMIFVGRHYSDMVEKERTLKRKGVTDAGTTPSARKTLGGDYRLGGRITSLDAVDTSSGFTSRFSQIVFEMVDLETSAIVWSGEYSYKKAAADDVIYR